MQCRVTIVPRHGDPWIIRALSGSWFWYVYPVGGLLAEGKSGFARTKERARCKAERAAGRLAKKRGEREEYATDTGDTT